MSYPLVVQMPPYGMDSEMVVALAAEQTSIGLHTRELEATVQLIRVLGGGWNPRRPARCTAAGAAARGALTHP